MAPAIIFTTNGEIMALKSKQTGLPEEFEENEVEQVSFDNLVGNMEAEYEEDQGETKVYYTLTGKEQDYNPQWDIYKSYEADVGDWLEGKPEVSIIEKKDKSYNALRVRIIDESTDEVLDCYLNFPKPDDEGFVTNITKSFDFYRNCFDFLYSILKCQGDKYVLDKNGDEYNRFAKIDFIGFAKLVDQKTRVKIEITEGNEDSDYNSWMITGME